jgi:hypothetical protein
MNRYSKSVVLAIYPQWSGGRFLINCLGISDQAYLQDLKLVEKQISGNLSPAAKQLELLKRLDNVGKTWNDLDLGCRFLYGGTPQLPESYPSIIDKISKEDKKFFVVAHDTSMIDNFLNVWAQPKLLVFKHNFNFVEWRWGANNIFDLIKKYPHLKVFPNFEKLQVAEKTLCEKVNVFSNSKFEWDSRDFLNEDKFESSLSKCYEFIELENYNYDLVRPFYKKYISTLERLKSND